MRQAINNLQSTSSGFGLVSPENVYKICDQPHPHKIRAMIKECQKQDIDGALARIDELWDAGYSAVDIVTTIFRVTKSMDEVPEYLKLEYIRVSISLCSKWSSLPRGNGDDENEDGADVIGNWVDAYAYIGRRGNACTARRADCALVQDWYGV